MRFIHIGDIHLGRSLGEFDLGTDQKYILDQIVGIVKERQVDGVLIAGDVYDRRVPSEAATRLLDRFLAELTEAGAVTFMISGNHDSDERLNYGRSFFASGQVYISALYEGELFRKTLSDSFGDIDIYLLPFIKASRVRHFFPDAGIVSYDDAVRTVIEKADIDDSRRNIIVAHQFVAGRHEDPVPAGSERAGTQSVGTLEKVSYESFESFDYVALGHIHSPQKVGRDSIRYAGSPLKYSLSEVNNIKSVPLITIEEKGNVGIELIPLRPLRDLRHIRGKMSDLLEGKGPDHSDDFIYVTLTDEDIVNDAMGIFQQVYPNTVKIDYDNSHTREIEEVDISRIADNRSFSDLISDFYNAIYGCDISDEEMEIMREVAREAGVLNETD